VKNKERETFSVKPVTKRLLVKDAFGQLAPQARVYLSVFYSMTEKKPVFILT
jgi:hypothetical protein